MQMVQTALCFLFAALLVATTILLGGDLVGFFDLPSLLLVAGLCLCVTLGTHGPAALRAALVAGLRGQAEEDTLTTHVAVLGTLHHTLLASGAVGTVVGIVLILQQMDDPTHFGPAMAVALLTLFYAIGAAELVVAPAAQRLAAQVPVATAGAPQPADEADEADEAPQAQEAANADG